ncbi:MAG: DUF1343 domain-containing protein [Verrucomicrobiae bacterium]|nr:DUF1343 domain-containing protein [Verrucomicrobiae bacterium]
MRPFFAFLIAVMSLVGPGVARAGDPSIRTGIDVLVRSDFEQLENKRVGLITNPTGVDAKLRSTVELLAGAKNLKLVALFGPEHGVYGDEYAGQAVQSGRDSRTNVPVYSLYGDTRKPTPEMLQDVDVMVLDLQDIGSRSYTYISTMKLALEACAENHVKLVVLDRPNPLGGQRVEGPPHETGSDSFVNALDVPYVHGMTMGELAKMQEAKIKKAHPELADTELVYVVRMQGWTRFMNYQDTGLPWVPTSPHIPEATTPYFYAATGLVGELDSVSIGVGYPTPFQTIAAPWIDADKFSAAMNDRNLPGVRFVPVHYKPFYAAFKGQVVHGAQIYFTDVDRANLTEIQFHAVEVLKKLHPDHPLFADSDTGMFDQSCGGPSTRNWLLSGKSVTDLFKKWRERAEAFRDERAPYLMYGFL